MAGGWLVEALHGVAELGREAVDIVEVAYDGEAVADLHTQPRGCQQVDAGTVDARAVDVVTLVEVEGAECDAVIFGFRHYDAA